MPVIDLSFRLSGSAIPADHGYSLYGALSRICPFLHAPPGEGEASGFTCGVHPVNGVLTGNRMLTLNKDSRLTLRLDSTHIINVLAIAGKELNIDGHQVVIGIPEPKALKPAETLYARLVTIKDMLDPNDFLTAAKRQLDALGVSCDIGLILREGPVTLEGHTPPAGRSPYVRRTLRIKDREIVGFALRVDKLSPEHSLLVQEYGVGGRRRFGCGIFVPR